MSDPVVTEVTIWEYCKYSDPILAKNSDGEVLIVDAVHGAMFKMPSPARFILDDIEARKIARAQTRLDRA